MKTKQTKKEDKAPVIEAPKIETPVKAKKPAKEKGEGKKTGPRAESKVTKIKAYYEKHADKYAEKLKKDMVAPLMEKFGVAEATIRTQYYVWRGGRK
jgi:hypothetical protein